MKTKTLGGHDEFLVRGSQLTSLITSVMSIVKYVMAVIGIALMVFK